jgi:hypothetical protein
MLVIAIKRIIFHVSLHPKEDKAPRSSCWVGAGIPEKGN